MVGNVSASPTFEPAVPHVEHEHRRRASRAAHERAPATESTLAPFQHDGQLHRLTFLPVPQIVSDYDGIGEHNLWGRKVTWGSRAMPRAEKTNPRVDAAGAGQVGLQGQRHVMRVLRPGFETSGCAYSSGQLKIGLQPYQCVPKHPTRSHVIGISWDVAVVSSLPIPVCATQLGSKMVATCSTDVPRGGAADLKNSLSSQFIGQLTRQHGFSSAHSTKRAEGEGTTACDHSTA
jgi:hypothetical protein